MGCEWLWDVVTNLSCYQGQVVQLVFAELAEAEAADQVLKDQLHFQRNERIELAPRLQEYGFWWMPSKWSKGIPVGWLISNADDGLRHFQREGTGETWLEPFIHLFFPSGWVVERLCWGWHTRAGKSNRTLQLARQAYREVLLPSFSLKERGASCAQCLLELHCALLDTAYFAFLHWSRSSWGHCVMAWWELISTECKHAMECLQYMRVVGRRNWSKTQLNQEERAP